MGGYFQLLGRLELEPLGLETPRSLLGISGGADRDGFAQALGSFGVRGLGSIQSHLLGRI